jgi:hypothetical protein
VKVKIIGYRFVKKHRILPAYKGFLVVLKSLDPTCAVYYLNFLTQLESPVNNLGNVEWSESFKIFSEVEAGMAYLNFRRCILFFHFTAVKFFSFAKLKYMEKEIVGTRIYVYRSYSSTVIASSFVLIK